MKKRMIVLTLLTCVLLSACQVTPTQGIVKEKNLDKMIEEAKGTQPLPSVSASEAAETVSPTECATKRTTIAGKIGAEKTYVKELTDAKGKVKIHVNADVEIPDVAGVAVQRVRQARFTQAQADTLVRYLMKGDIFSGRNYRRSKQDIQKQILQVKALIAKNDTPKAIKIMQNYELTDLQKELKAASEKETVIPCDSRLLPRKEGNELYVLCRPADGTYHSLQLYNHVDGLTWIQYSSEKNFFGKWKDSYATRESIEAAAKQTGWTDAITPEVLATIPDITISKEEARKKADGLIQALGLQNVTCIAEDKEYGGCTDKTVYEGAYVNPQRCVWFLRYAREVNGVPLTYTTYDCAAVEATHQSDPWQYEDIQLAVDDSGIVYFEWRSPYNMSDIVTENSKLLSFVDAMNVFNTMCPVVNAWDGFDKNIPGELKSVEIHIDKIVFGMTRVTEQNKRDSGLLIPVWDFMGTVTSTFKKDGKEQTQVDGPLPLLTVNAIDGSIINRNLGY